jgi:hypothetical protein
LEKIRKTPSGVFIQGKFFEKHVPKYFNEDKKARLEGIKEKWKVETEIFLIFYGYNLLAKVSYLICQLYVPQFSTLTLK